MPVKFPWPGIEFGTPHIHDIEMPAKLSKKLSTLWKARDETERLLFGDMVNSPIKVLIEPDFAGLEPKLRALKTRLKFDCIELARILTCRPNYSKWIQHYPNVPPKVAAGYLLRRREGAQNSPAALGLMIPWQGGAGLIEAATEKGDTEFFIRLGWHLQNQQRPRRRATTDLPHIDLPTEFDIIFCLDMFWQPIPPIWPGLAYCSRQAQRRFCQIALNKEFLFSSNEAKNFRQKCRRWGLKTSRNPLVSILAFSTATRRITIN